MPLYRQEERLTPEETDQCFEREERRVGHSLYHTACPTCRACQGLRILVNEFSPSPSQRRVWKRWQDLGERLEVRVGTPTVSEEKVRLYNRHKVERGLSDPGDLLDEAGYLGWLVQSCVPTMEMTYHLDGRLIGVGILDVGRWSTSSVYFYFEPSRPIARLSPGVFSVLAEVAWGRQTGRRYHYLGLYVEGAPTLSYKGNYFPHERLRDGAWRRQERDQGQGSSRDSTGSSNGIRTSP